jgi:hypothetical protein
VVVKTESGSYELVRKKAVLALLSSGGRTWGSRRSQRRIRSKGLGSLSNTRLHPSASAGRWSRIEASASGRRG